MSNRYAAYDGYGLRHLPRHLIRSERWQDLAGKLTDFEFLEAKCHRFSVYELEVDYRASLFSWPGETTRTQAPSGGQRQVLAEIADAIRAQGHNVADAAHLLYQQVRYQLASQGMGWVSLKVILEEGESYVNREARSWFKPLEIAYRSVPVLTLRGHLNSVTDCSIAGNGRLAASAGQDGTVRIWDLQSGQRLHILGKPAVLELSRSPRVVARYALARMVTGYSATVRACAFSTDGCYVISVGPSEELGIWDIITGAELCRITDVAGYVQSCAIYRDSGGIAVYSCTDDNACVCSVYRLPTGEKVHERVVAEDVAQLVGSPDGRVLVQVPPKGGLRIRETSEDERQGVRDLVWLNRHDRSGGLDTRGRVISLGNRHFLIASAIEAHVVDLATLKRICVLGGHESIITCCTVMPDGPLAATASMDGAAIVWDLDSGQEVVRLVSDETIHACTIAPSGEFLLTADGSLMVEDFSSRGGMVQMWRIKERSTPRGQIVRPSPVKALCAAPGSAGLVSVRENGYVRLHDWGDITGLRSFQLETDPVAQCMLADEGRKLFYGGDGAGLKVLSLDREARGRTLSDCEVKLMAGSQDSRLMATFSSEGVLDVWDTRSEQRLLSRACSIEDARKLCFSPESNRLFMISKDRINQLSLPSQKLDMVLDGETSVSSAWQCLCDYLDAEGIPARPLQPHHYCEEFRDATVTADAKYLISVSRLVPRGDPHAFKFVITERGMDSARHLDPLPEYVILSIWSLEHMADRSGFAAARGDHCEIMASSGGRSSLWVTCYHQGYRLVSCGLEGGGHPLQKLEFGSSLRQGCAVVLGRYRLTTIDAEGLLSVYEIPAFTLQGSIYINTVDLTCVSMVEQHNVVALGYRSGDVDILQIQNASVPTPQCTATRMWLPGGRGASGRWDDELTSLCGWCGQRFGLKDVAVSVKSVTLTGSTMGEWIACPYCGKPLRINPFVVDNA